MLTNSVQSKKASDGASTIPKAGSLFLRIVWLSVPSLLWSLVFHSVTFCFDPLLVFAVSSRLSKPAVSLFRAVWAVAFVVALLWAWNIRPGVYWFYVREALPFSPPSVLYSCAAALAFLSWFILYKSQQAPLRLSRGCMSVWIVIVGIKLFIMLFGQPTAFQKVFKSQFITVVRMGYLGALTDRASSVVGTPHATYNIFMRNQSALPRKLVLMIVESWGERQSDLGLMLARMKSDGLKVVDSGFTTYHGATLSGEFRELCSRYVAPTDTTINSDSLDCAPQLLGKRGYDTLGLHGYQKEFYARQTFWRRFGIQDGFFNDSMTTLERCPGPFPGICDDKLIGEGVKRLFADEKKRFLYLLTLSSHEPLIDASLVRPPGRLFEDIPVAHRTQIVTRRAISSLITELEHSASHECVLAYVVGDHQPPSSARTGIFQVDKVPFIAFEYNCQ